MKKTTTARISAKAKREIGALRNKPDSEIDTSETRVLPPEKWANAVVGKFYRPIKQPLALRLDADVLAWFKEQGPGYQSRINAVLRRRLLLPPFVNENSFTLRLSGAAPCAASGVPTSSSGKPCLRICLHRHEQRCPSTAAPTTQSAIPWPQRYITFALFPNHQTD
jgi:uncharacterized protein (DUF4415 family)